MQLVHNSVPAVRRDRLIRLPQVEQLVGIKKTSIYRLMRANAFPRCVRLGHKCVAWPESAVLQWVQDRRADAMSAGGPVDDESGS